MDLISESSANKAITINNAIVALSPASLFAKRESTSGGLVFGYYGGRAYVGGVSTVIADGTITLTASATNYLEFNTTTGAVVKNTTGWTGAGYTPLYSVVVGTSTITGSPTDFRIFDTSGLLAAAAALDAAHVASATVKHLTVAELAKLQALPTSASTVKTVAMSANAGTVTISTAQHNIVEITGTNTAQGNITASLDASGVSFLATFDNASGYANTINSNSSWLIPVGRSNWYYNASLAQFEQINYTQQQVDALIAQIYTNSATFSGAVTFSGGMIQAPLTVPNGAQGGIAHYRRSWESSTGATWCLIASLPTTSPTTTGDHTIIRLMVSTVASSNWATMQIKIANNTAFLAEIIDLHAGATSNFVIPYGGIAIYTQADGSQNVYLHKSGSFAFACLAEVHSGGNRQAATLIHPSSLSDIATTPPGTLSFSTLTATPRRSTSPTSSLNSVVYGYQSGQGGTVTQATSKSTGVTLNKLTGDITLNAASLAAGTVVSFVLTNSNIAASSLVNVAHNSAGTMAGYTIAATPSAGSATIYVRNNTAGALAEAIVLRFAITQAQTA